MRRSRERSPGQIKGQVRSRSFGKERGNFLERQLVFGLSPSQLKALCDFEDSGEEWLDEGSEADDESTELDGNDVENELGDEDEASEPRTDGNHDLGYAAYLNERADVTAVLDVNQAYAVDVQSWDDRWSCGYEPPSWMRRKFHGSRAEFIKKHISFLSSMARWFEENCQAFLAHPAPETFAREFAGESEPPVVQKWLGEAIRKRSPDGARINDVDMSRLLPWVWLFWTDRHLAVQVVCSPEYRFAWAVESCILQYGRTGVCPETYDREFSRKEKQDLRNKPLHGLSAVAYLVAASSRVGVRPGTVLDEVKKRLQEGHVQGC